MILETGELGTYDNVRRASLLAIAAGADFIKTSTGKVSRRGDAAGDAVHARGDPRRPRRDGPHRRDEARGRDPHGEAGGPVPRACSTRRSAHEWLTPDLFRFGASSLLNDVLMQIRKQRTGALPDPATTSRSTDDCRSTTDAQSSAVRRRRSSGSTRRRPRRATSSSFEERYGLFIGGEEVEPRSGEWFPTISPVDRGAARRGRAGGPEDVDLAVERRPRRLRERLVDDSRPSERAKYLFRIARILQERSRELAVAESLDGGKPIKESRDVDLPLAAAHFFYYAGWADKLEYAFPNRKPRPLGVAGADHPVELPAADARVEDRARARVREHRRAQAGRDDAADRAALRGRLPPGGAAAGRRQHRHGRRHDRARTSSSTTASTRSRSPARPRSGKAIQRELAGHGQAADARARRQGREHRLRRRALDQAVEGIVNGIYFNQGHVCCAGSRLLVQESIYEPLVEKLKRRLATLRVGDPLDKNTDVGAINSQAAARAGSRELVASGRGGRRRDLPAAVPAAGAGLLVRADGLHERRAELPHRAGGDLRAGAARC